MERHATRAANWEVKLQFVCALKMDNRVSLLNMSLQNEMGGVGFRLRLRYRN
jgi:hypothetical protein